MMLTRYVTMLTNILFCINLKKIIVVFQFSYIKGQYFMFNQWYASANLLICLLLVTSLTQ